MANEQNKTTDADTARGLYDTAKSTVGQAYGAATKRATSALDEQKGTIAEGLTTVAESVRQVGENLETAPQNNAVTNTAARYTDSIARQIEKISGYFERKDVRDMVRDVESFARNNPAYFIGGAVAIGFVAARFLKSSNPQRMMMDDGGAKRKELPRASMTGTSGVPENQGLKTDRDAEPKNSL